MSESEFVVISVIAPAEFTARFSGVCDGVAVVDRVSLSDGEPSPVFLDPPLRPWDIHTVNYTSGTTGAPKGVLTTHQHSYAAALHNDWRATPDDILLTTSPLFHCGGQVISTGAWLGGACVALRDSFRASNFLEVVRESGATMTLLVGTMAAVLDATPQRPDDADNPLRLLMIPENSCCVLTSRGRSPWATSTCRKPVRGRGVTGGFIPATSS